MNQYNDIKYAGSYNVGPNEADCWTTGELATLFCDEWKRMTGQTVIWRNVYDGGPHEANLLKLDCSKIKNTFGWRNVWNVEEAMSRIIKWHICYQNSSDIISETNNQIYDFLENIG